VPSAASTREGTDESRNGRKERGRVERGKEEKGTFERGGYSAEEGAIDGIV